LERIWGTYQTALDLVQAKLEGLGYHPTTRVKTTTTLIEKLIREQSMKMKGVQDIAGARIVVEGGRLDQNAVVQQVVGAFTSAPGVEAYGKTKTSPAARR
jgi:ppGpp synthetase/RelA/SpoT-type nucleotidyltranferase